MCFTIDLHNGVMLPASWNEKIEFRTHCINETCSAGEKDFLNVSWQ